MILTGYHHDERRKPKRQRFIPRFHTSHKGRYIRHESHTGHELRDDHDNEIRDHHHTGTVTEALGGLTPFDACTIGKTLKVGIMLIIIIQLVFEDKLHV